MSVLVLSISLFLHGGPTACLSRTRYALLLIFRRVSGPGSRLILFIIVEKILLPCFVGFFWLDVFFVAN